MPKLEDWLEKVKKTKLRTWLNLQDLVKLIEEKKTPKVYLLAQSAGGVRSLTARIEGIAQRYEATPEGGGQTTLVDLLLDCKLILENELRPLQLKASAFIPDTNNEMGTLSRIFAYELHRDHFLEDTMFCMDLIKEANAEHYKRSANNMFRRFLGGDGPTPA